MSELETRELEQFVAVAEELHFGRAAARLSIAQPALAHETLHVEQRVAILPVGHRLAGRAELRLADLADETLPRWRGVPGQPDADTGPLVADVVQLAHLVAAGRVVAVLPRSLVEPLPAGVVCVPVADAPPSRLVIAWPERDRRPLVAAFVEAARGVASTTAKRAAGAGESRRPARP